MRCPNCKNRLLQKSGDTTRLRARGPLLFKSDGTCNTQCYWCKSDVTVPVSIEPDVRVDGERFFLRKGDK